MEEPNKGGDPSTPNAADTSATVKAPEVAETTVPKSRFDEVYEAKKASDEKARIYKEALDQNKNATEEEKKLREEAEARVRATEQVAWRANALRGVDPRAAAMIDGLGAQFLGNSQEEYMTWAKTLESKVLPELSSKASVDGNRSNDTPTEITQEVIDAMPPKERLAYLSKVLPRNTQQ